MFKHSKSSLTHTLLAAILTISPLKDAISAPGTLPAAPLFLSTLVEPNVYFTLDDSGSMDWGLMLAENAGGLITSSGLTYLDGSWRAYYSPTFSQLYTYRAIPPI